MLPKEHEELLFVFFTFVRETRPLLTIKIKIAAIYYPDWPELW
jgi:hypothetical protein